MLIKQAKQAIRYYELAIKNTQDMLSHQIAQDLDYQEFEQHYIELGFTVIFYHSTYEFSFYKWRDDRNSTSVFFNIKNGEIVYKEASNALENVRDIAKELQSIVQKFYN